MFSSGSLVMPLLLAAGVWLSVKSGLFQIRGLRYILQNTVGGLFRRDKHAGKNITSFQAVTTALAGTMGVGNIAGVATALVAGGPGAIFWMWVSAFFGMATKYAEIFLAVKYRRRDDIGRYRGGAMYYLEHGVGSKRLAALFAILCALCSLGIGNLAQMNSVSGAMRVSFGVPAPVCGVLAAVLVGAVICGGMRRIARVTEFVIPLLSAAYLCFAGVFLWRSRAMLPDAFRLIFAGAFGLREMGGGVLGYGVGRALRFGLSRGVFTNEAGLGSAPTAHASADCESASAQAAWGVVEVFLDTIAVCTVTALVILCAGSGALWRTGLDGAPLTSAAFESAFPSLGAGFVSVSIAFFAFAAMLGWYFYGESALGYLAGGKRLPLLCYRAVFLCCAALGSVAELRAVWGISDLLNALMAVPNCIALVALHREVIWGETGRTVRRLSRKNQPKYPASSAKNVSDAR